jgi:hypothetical protein
MQATLDSNEFAFLLHILNAKAVIGVNNSFLFPADDTLRESLLSQGFNMLQEHGWLLSEDSKFITNTGLALMAAAIASPERTIMLTRYMPKGRQTITYYLAQDIIVEQFLTSDQQYFLTRLDTLFDVIDRLWQALQIPDANRMLKEEITIEIGTFENAMKQAKSGDLSILISALHKAGLDSEACEQLAKAIITLHPVGDIELSVLSGVQIKGWDNIVFLHSQDNSVWAMMRNQESESVTLYPLDAKEFSQLIQVTLGELSTVILS